MIAKPLLLQQPVTAAGDAPSRDLVEIVQRIVTDLIALDAVAISSSPGDAPRFACRAWVEFNGTGTPAIRASGNVASITDNGVGDYTINFSTAMPDADYAVMGSARYDTTNANDGHPTVGIRRITGAKTTTSVRITVINPATNAAFDADIICVAIFR